MLASKKILLGDYGGGDRLFKRQKEMEKMCIFPFNIAIIHRQL